MSAYSQTYICRLYSPRHHDILYNKIKQTILYMKAYANLDLSTFICYNFLTVVCRPYSSQIGTEPTLGESDPHLIKFFLN